MSRWIWFLSCAVVGLATFVCGLLIPAHLRAIDAGVLELAGRNSPGVVAEGLQLALATNRTAAQLLLDAARAENLPGQEQLAAAIATLPDRGPDISKGLTPGPEPFTEFTVHFEHRQKLLDLLQASRRADVQALLRLRSRTNTVLFPPSSSSSGQAFDTAIAVTGALLEDGRVSEGLSQDLFTLASEANVGGDSGRIEQALLDILSLGQRFSWGQLTVFVYNLNDLTTLGHIADQVRDAGDRLPVVFSAVYLSRNPAGVAIYLTQFSDSGPKDLRTALRFNAGGLNELLQRNQRLHTSVFRPLLALDYCLRQPRVALIVKWFCYLAGGFLIGAALQFARGDAMRDHSPLARGIFAARDVLFALGFLTVVLLLSEPFLAQESQKTPPRFQLRLPTVGSVAGSRNPAVKSTSFMNQSVLAISLFFVLQALIYTSCRAKLAEINRQRLPPRVKLKLLDNEDHLFDAGLYLGFVGTIISFILVSLGVIKPSLMAAYSSTSFGIIFVSAFKIFNLRPVRRRLLMESETMPPVPTGPVPPSGTQLEPS